MSIDFGEWYKTLKREDDLLISELPILFLGKEELVEVCFIQTESLPSIVQMETLQVFVSRLSEILAVVQSAVFDMYQGQNEEYRKALKEWGEGADEFAPRISSSIDMAPLLNLQSLFIHDSIDAGEFGLGFWAKWDREHGVGVKFIDWRISEVGENSIHFQ